MVRNKTSFTFIDEKDATAQTEMDILKGASLHTRQPSKAGRKPKEVKADASLKIYVTKEEKGKIDAYCDQNRISASTLVKQLLVKENLL